jgi:hypothetical protein
VVLFRQFRKSKNDIDHDLPLGNRVRTFFWTKMDIGTRECPLVSRQTK